MGASEFADHVAQEVVAARELDRQSMTPVQWGKVQEKPYLPLRSLEAWSSILEVFANRIRTDNGRIGRYLSDAAELVQMAVWQYDKDYGDHANGPAPGNPQEK